MPITLAATSMSRMAIHSRPIAPRTRFLASRPNTTTKLRHSRYFCAGVSKLKPAMLQRADADRARGRVVGDPLHAVGEPVDEELRGQRGHRQVQAADAQAGDAEQHARHRGAQAAADQRQQQRHAVDAHLQVVGRIRAHRHEGAGAQRDLAAVADQDVEPDGGQREDQERNDDGAERVVAGQQRHGDERDGGERQQGPAVLRDGEQRGSAR